YLGYPRRYRPEDHTAVREALLRADAADLADRPLQQLSGGERQRVYLAMALAQDTETILMDEPTTYLDIAHQIEVMALARRLANEGKAVVLVLHDLCLALRCADEAAVLSQGRLLAWGNPEKIYESHVLEEVFGVKLRRAASACGWRYYYE
ncbi:MAG: ABC transporter ATP-binding protein, partial [Oscillibacter sp.]|nr:ABC transporter ATP-binding protein [Oscillibacter sp.]